MKSTLVYVFKCCMVTSILLFCNIAKSDRGLVPLASDYPYGKLLNRASEVKVFYSVMGGGIKCKVEISRDNIKWTSTFMTINKKNLNHVSLPRCLSREAAEQILIQTFLQFGRGL